MHLSQALKKKLTIYEHDNVILQEDKCQLYVAMQARMYLKTCQGHILRHSINIDPSDCHLSHLWPLNDLWPF